VSRTVKQSLTVAMCTALIGCAEVDMTERGEARIAMFRECMTLAAEMPRQSDDDVSEVVSACSTQAWYMTKHIGTKP
jgi:hypothetical protein